MSGITFDNVDRYSKYGMMAGAVIASAPLLWMGCLALHVVKTYPQTLFLKYVTGGRVTTLSHALFTSDYFQGMWAGVAGSAFRWGATISATSGAVWGVNKLAQNYFQNNRPDDD